MGLRKAPYAYIGMQIFGAILPPYSSGNRTALHQAKGCTRSRKGVSVGSTANKGIYIIGRFLGCSSENACNP